MCHAPSHGNSESLSRLHFHCTVPFLLIPIFLLICLFSGCQNSPTESEVPTAKKKTATAASDFTALTLEDFETFPPAEGNEPTWNMQDGVLSCSGSPKGYLFSEKVIQEFYFDL